MEEKIKKLIENIRPYLNKSNEIDIINKLKNAENNYLNNKMNLFETIKLEEIPEIKGIINVPL